MVKWSLGLVQIWELFSPSVGQIPEEHIVQCEPHATQLSAEATKLCFKNTALPLLFNIVLEVLTTAIREEKEIKGIHIGKEEVKFSLFADDMILYIENPKDSRRKLLELVNDIGKLQDIKLIHRNPLHSYTLTMNRIKYLGINLPK